MWPRNPKLIAAIVAIVIVGLGVWVAVSNNRPTNSIVTIDDQRKTDLTSPFTGTADTATLDLLSHGGSDPNQDAVAPRYLVFNAVNLGIPSNILEEFLDTVPNFIDHEVIPTYALSYIQINRDTIKCDTRYDCSMSFYLDSPERYFSYHMHLKSNGEKATVLKPEPMPGVGL